MTLAVFARRPSKCLLDVTIQLYVYLDRLFIQTDAFACPYSVHNRCLKKVSASLSS